MRKTANKKRKSNHSTLRIWSPFKKTNTLLPWSLSSSLHWRPDQIPLIKTHAPRKQGWRRLSIQWLINCCDMAMAYERTRECRKNFCAIHEALAKLYKSTKFPMVSWLNNSIKIMLPWLIGSKMPGARVEVLLAPDADVQKDGWNSWIHPCFCNVMSFNYSSVQKKLEDCEPWNWGAKHVPSVFILDLPQTQ